jgi:hypothetical protein
MKGVRDCKTQQHIIVRELEIGDYQGRNSWPLYRRRQEFLPLLRPLCPHIRYCEL